MHARTELLLYQLAWALDKMMRPTWRNLESSFESWAYGSGLLKQIHRLEAQAFIESRKDKASGKRVIRLTEKGLAAGRLGCDPEQRWHRSWDGRWRVILFDLPEEERQTRRKLRHQLAALGFGCMQRSAWISPDPLDDLAAELRGLAVNAAHLVFLDSTPSGGETSGDLVAATWDFVRINGAWDKLNAHLEAAPEPADSFSRELIVKWGTKEKNLLQRCFHLDPFLPKALHPARYLGMVTWKKRTRILSKLAKILASVPGTF
jgi:phenylacetic acid degradation operon negative regulatory protein